MPKRTFRCDKGAHSAEQGLKYADIGTVVADANALSWHPSYIPIPRFHVRLRMGDNGQRYVDVPVWRFYPRLLRMTPPSRRWRRIRDLVLPDGLTDKDISKLVRAAECGDR